MRVHVHHDIERFTADMDAAAERHVPFATARALTWTARDAQGDVRGGLPGRYTLRNKWVSNGIRITPATKQTMEARVGSIEPFMRRQEDGGRKRATRGSHRIAVPKAKPSKIIPRGQRPQAMRNKPRVFMLKTAGGAGIVRRQGRARYPLQLLYWLKRDVKVKPSFGFGVTTSNTVSRQFGTNFVESLSQAMGHRG